MKIWGFILILLTASCDKSMTLHKGEGNSYLKGGESKVYELKAIPWKVGTGNKKLVSQGFSFRVSTPSIGPDDALYLYKKHGIDSWVFRLSKLGGGDQTVGYAVVQFTTSKDRPEFFRVTQASIQVLYASAYASERFRAFDCPAFNHRKLIVDPKIEDNGVSDFRVETYPEKTLNSALEISFYHPSKTEWGHRYGGYLSGRLCSI
jgi:hypothetical protein